MKILLTGASGFIGAHILQALLQQGHSVVACSHRHTIEQHHTPPLLQSIKIDFTKMLTVEAWLDYLQDIDVVINSVGIITETEKQHFEILHHQAPACLFAACEVVGIKRVIQLSALGVDTAIVPYQHSKKQADDALQASSLTWFILRPSLVYGKGGKSFALFQRLSNLPITPLVGDGKQRIQPVHYSDVVATVLRCLDNDVVPQQIINVVGEQPIYYRDWMHCLRERSSKSRFLPIPLSVMMLLSRWGKWLRLPVFSPDSLRMLQQHNEADSSKLSAFLGRKPRAITHRRSA